MKCVAYCKNTKDNFCKSPSSIFNSIKVVFMNGLRRGKSDNMCFCMTHYNVLRSKKSILIHFENDIIRVKYDNFFKDVEHYGR